MPTAEELRKRRRVLREREGKVERLIVADQLDLRRVLEEIEEERAEREHYQARRKDLREQLEEEIRRDERGRGEHPERWEEWAESRRDELADLVDASHARVLRLLERASKERHGLRDLRQRDRRLEREIEVVERRLDRKRRSADQLTKDFHLAEFDCNDGTPVPSYMEPHLREMCRRHLQPLRDSGGPVHVNSGYRHADYNASIGGATESYHIYELRKRSPAVDHVQSGRAASEVQRWHDGHDDFDGMGYYAGFTHGDDRGYRSRWWGAA